MEIVLLVLMTFYYREVQRIKKLCYANQAQIDVVVGMRNYIDRHFESDLQLEALSRVCQISKFHLLRLFRKYYGQTPGQYLITRRLVEAKKLLLAGKTVTETCFTVGYESPGSFSNLFKRRVGVTPGQFQKRNFEQGRQAKTSDLVLSIKKNYENSGHEHTGQGPGTGPAVLYGKAGLH